ncbi:hypothetical protein CEXT_506451 [Caerostris extrusa]|uniref:Uncharacterized protein n=1 Tax=Caerostris extrusa TaxID=172846 RepID=A0AAV4QTF9_CAEEX|nr:hypothetical protein CEXT_506451 [Caerostris extrusa]
MTTWQMIVLRHDAVALQMALRLGTEAPNDNREGGDDKGVLQMTSHPSPNGGEGVPILIVLTTKRGVDLRDIQRGGIRGGEIDLPELFKEGYPSDEPKTMLNPITHCSDGSKAILNPITHCSYGSKAMFTNPITHCSDGSKAMLNPITHCSDGSKAMLNPITHCSDGSKTVKSYHTLQ